MSPRLRGRHRRADLPAMLVALDEAVEALEGRADPEALRRARSLSERAGERLRLSGEHTVVALAGSTGSGKSSLFNALSGSDLSPVGVRRPTTAKAFASVWGTEGAAPLVQWLGVPRRQTTWRHGAEDQPDTSAGGGGAPPAVDDELEGLVLLDLPDHDSTVTEHQLEVDRLVELVDLLVWVVDPQKYADQVLHERYLRRLSGHSAVTVVVLNQVDTVNPFAAAECAEDLRRLLDEDGLRRSPVLTTSARTGAGLDGLRALLVDAVSRRRARNDRLVADVERVVEVLNPAVALGEPDGVASAERARLVEALASAAGVPVIGRAVEKSWRLRAAGSLGWPPTRWVRRLRPDPLRRLHLRSGERREVRDMVRSSVPKPTPVQRAQVDTALRKVCDAGAVGLPDPWQRSVRSAADGRAGDVRDALDRAVVGTDLGVDRVPLWWRLAGALQWLLVAAALVGAGWLLLLAFGSYLRLPDPPTPDVRGVPVPTALLVGGVVVGLVVAFVGRLVAHAGAAARRRRAESRLRSSIEKVATTLMLAPVDEELARHKRARDALDRARTG
ncbi:MAG: 50S ribosome-binding GTPase [Spirochaetaceae bacterium]|nr:50S ribosome-binding GTPase [Spirochaetaceae bacterium]